VSLDGGATYNMAMGTTTWSYNWTPTSPGPASIRSRAVDNSGNQQTTPAEIIVTVVAPGAPLEIVLTTPAPGATGISTGVTPTATFSKDLNLGSLSIGNPAIATILLRDASNNPVPFNLYVHVPTLRTLIVPEPQLQPEQTYTVTFKGGPNAPHITDEGGMPLASDFNLSFTTATAPQQIVSVTPAPGSFQVPTTVAPAATFSVPLDPASVNESTVLLSDVWNDRVPATIFYDASNFKVTITPERQLQGGSYIL
jgi:hypothetical protein